MPHIDVNLSDIPDGRPVRVEDDRRGIVVVREGDRIAAFEDVCPHAQWRLSDGELIEGVLECPGHGWEFNPQSGRCLTVPAYCLKAVRVERSGNSIRLFIESESATPGTVGEHGQALV